MAIAGALIGKAIGAFGKKPKVPELPIIDPSAVQLDTVAGNLGVLPEAQKLASGVTDFNLAELAKALEFAVPGGLGQAQSNIFNQLSGVADVADTRSAIRNATAAGWQSGTAGSMFGNLNVVGQLGRSVAEQRQQGFLNFMNLGNQAASRQFDVSSMFFSPQQRLSFAAMDRTERFQRDLLAAQVKAAPDPATAALGREIDRFFNTWAQYGMASLGKLGGGSPAPSSGGGGGGGGGGGFTSMSGMQWLGNQVNAGSAGGQGI